MSERCKWFIGAYTFLFLFSYEKLEGFIFQLISFFMALVGSALLATTSIAFGKAADPLEDELEGDDPAHSFRKQPTTVEIPSKGMAVYRFCLYLLGFYVIFLIVGFAAKENEKETATKNVIVNQVSQRDTIYMVKDTNP